MEYGDFQVDLSVSEFLEFMQAYADELEVRRNAPGQDRQKAS
jgi:hypothetical protein